MVPWSSPRSHGRRGHATPGHADHAESRRPLRHGGAAAPGISELMDFSGGDFSAPYLEV